MKIYNALSKIGFLKNSYVAKFMLVVFLAVNIPVLLFSLFLYYGRSYLAPTVILIITAVAMLLISFIILKIIQSLLIPFKMGSKALMDYTNSQTNPQLPSNLTDEAGVMLKNIQTTIQVNQKLLIEKRDLSELLTTDLRDRTLQTEKYIKEIALTTTDAKTKLIAERAADAVQQQIDFVDKYVDILRQEEYISKQPIKVRKINMQDLLDDVKPRFKAELQNKNIELKYSLKTIRVRLKVSGTLLQLAIGYILEFTLKTAPENSKIEILTDRNRGKLLIQIRNQGVSINSADVEKIFDKFYVLTKNETEEAIPLGNELYLCGKIIERFGGTITAEPGGKSGGTIFSMDLRMYR